MTGYDLFVKTYPDFEKLSQTERTFFIEYIFINYTIRYKEILKVISKSEREDILKALKEIEDE